MALGRRSDGSWKHYMMVTNMQGEVAHATYFGNHGASCIDMCFAPLGLKNRQMKSSVLPRLGARLQAFRGAPPKDHVPVYLEFIAEDLPALCAGSERVRWNADAMMEALLTGKGRRDFLAAVEKRLLEDAERGNAPKERDGVNANFEYLEKDNGGDRQAALH